MPTAIETFTAPYAFGVGGFTEVVAGEFIVPGHELVRRFPARFGPDSLTGRLGRGNHGSSHPATRGSGPGARSQVAGLPQLRHVPRYRVTVTPSAYESVDHADYDGYAETGGILVGHKSAEGITVEEASGPGPHAERSRYRMRVDWDYLDRMADVLAYKGTVQGHWHSHPDDAEPGPTDQDLVAWSSLLDHERSGVIVGVIISEGTPYLRWDAWTVSDRDGVRVCEPAILTLEEWSV